MDFVLVNKGKAVGPYSAERVREAIKAGDIARNAKIWRPPWSDWTEAASVFPADFGLTDDFVAEMEKKGEIRHTPEETLLDRVQQQVPSAQIEELLRKAKAAPENPRDVLITSRNKQELVHTNLKQAVSNGFVSKEAVEKLVRELTETGGQRIFLYRLKQNVQPRNLSVEIAGMKLLGSSWTASSEPIFHALPAKPQISSLRAYALEAEQRGNPYGFDAPRARGWILTIDSSVRVEERIDNKLPSNSDISFRTTASKLEDATVVMRYWEKLQVLELRVPNFQKRATVLELRDSIWHSVSPKLGLDEAFEPWLLANACTKSLTTLLNTPKDEPTLRRISGTLLREKNRSTMKIEIENSEVEGVLDSNPRKVSVQAYLKHSSVVESAIAYYQPSANKEEIRVVIAADCPYEISVRKSIIAWHLDHVIYRLYSNS